MPLPLLPGNDFTSRAGRANFSKSHHFDVCNDIAMNVGAYKPGIGGEVLPGQQFKQHSVYPAGEGEAAPAWLAFDRQVLCFDGYFHESVVPTISREGHRIRPVKVLFYLEDDSIQVIEPPSENSGIPQGTFIRRHRIPLPAPDSSRFYCFENFNIGVELEFYGKTFHLIRSDKFTVNFLTKMGVKVGEPSNIPVDPHTTIRRQMQEEMKPLRPIERIDTLRQFLVYDRHVLRFNCYLDDEDEYREVILHYFLADDTLEIREVMRPNSGRDAVPVFVKRAKLPKNSQAVFPPGVITSRTVLNVTLENHILDSLKTGAVKQDFYTDADLQIDNVINVWGRAVKLVDCDEFTKDYYRTKYDVQSFAPVENKAHVKPAPVPPRDIAPYNGFGSHEDSRANCDSLLPRPPQKDFKKFIAMDREGMDSRQLRFVCQLATDDPVQKLRRFVVTFYLSDDTIAVFESSGRNSGIIGGKFMERSRVPLPQQDLFSSSDMSFYTISDFALGVTLTFNKQQFVVVGADDYALNYMEQHPDKCPQSSLSALVEKVKSKCTPELLTSATEKLTTNSVVSLSVLSDVLSFAELTQHELVTVARAFPTEAHVGSCDTLIAIVQDNLRKKRFDDFDGLLRKLQYEDIANSGFLPSSVVLPVVKSFKIPVDSDKLNALVQLTSSEDGTVDYNKLVSLINYQSNPSRPSTSEDYAPKSTSVVDVPVCSSIDYKSLMSALSV